MSLDDETEQRFRENVIRIYGNKKGALSITGEQAIRE